MFILSFDAARQDPKCYVQEVAKEFDGRRTYSFFVGQMQGILILSLLRQQRRVKLIVNPMTYIQDKYSILKIYLFKAKYSSKLQKEFLDKYASFVKMVQKIYPTETVPSEVDMQKILASLEM